MAQLNPYSTGCPLWTQHGLNAMTPPSPPVPTTVPASFTDQFNTLIEASKTIYHMVSIAYQCFIVACLLSAASRLQRREQCRACSDHANHQRL